ncbi:hypothetical protein EGR_10697 [Echinococcus granulosus]|uniref:Uncharacterized protein n=1 Tax=Echinococcus granulosus TaxID=6210 RepID=W6U051_ECHGR|nr:hypothetical protein EGR_10697 [Echinococcus granulosus]EUB54445.1 hypothetical protein EGR_10697 [Echinococcus granulosus]
MAANTAPPHSSHVKPQVHSVVAGPVHTPLTPSRLLSLCMSEKAIGNWWVVFDKVTLEQVSHW